MKKLTLFISLLCCLQVSNAQKWTKHDIDSAYKANLDTTGLTVKEVYKDAKEGFQMLVSKLQGPAKHVYEIYVRQYIVSGICSLLVCIFAWIFAVQLFKYGKNGADWTDETAKYNVAFVFGIIVYVLSFILTIGFFYIGLQKILNPEYFAIERIIDSFT